MAEKIPVKHILELGWSNPKKSYKCLTCSCRSDALDRAEELKASSTSDKPKNIKGLEVTCDQPHGRPVGSHVRVWLGVYYDNGGFGSEELSSDFVCPILQHYNSGGRT